MGIKAILICFISCSQIFCFGQESKDYYYREAYLESYKGSLDGFHLKNRQTSNNLVFTSSKESSNFYGKLQKATDTTKIKASFRLDGLTDFDFYITIVDKFVIIEADRRSQGLGTMFLNDYCTIWELGKKSYLILFNDFRDPDSESFYFKVETTDNE